MENLMPYIIKVNLGILLMYVVYYFLLRKETFFTVNRYYLLFGILFSLAYPFLQIDIFSLLGNDVSQQFANIYYAELSPIVVTAGETVVNSSFEWRNLLWIGILFVTLVLVLRLIVQCVSILFLKNKCFEKVTIENTTIIDISSLSLAPFSFFNWIFIDVKNHSANELREIITHEKIHAQQFHSVDVLLSQFICALFWWNPLVWLLEKDIKLNLEYIADKAVLEAGINSKHYQYNLLNMINSKAAAITNNFNVSHLKKRISMMNDKRTPLINLTKYIAIIPMVGILVFMNNCTSNEENTAPSEITEELDEESGLPIITELTYREYPKDGVLVYESVEVMPEYPGGVEELLKFVQANLVYPAKAVDDGTEGRVYVRFVVEKDGTVDDVTVVKGFNEECEKEAVRVIKMMPKWIPGTQKGEPVAVYYNLPVLFKFKADSDT